MIPAYKPGDHVLTFNWGKIKKGDVVVFILLHRHPEPFDCHSERSEESQGKLREGSRMDSIDPSGLQNDKLRYIKRVDEIKGNLCYVSGDNEKGSAKLGPIKREQVIGKVVLKY